MRQSCTTHSSTQPDEIKFVHLHKDLYEVIVTDSVQLTQDEQHDGEGNTTYTTGYNYKMWLDRATIKNYDEAVAAVIGAKYSFADEIALMRKDKSSDEYLKYISFVAKAKAIAGGVFAR